MLDHKTITTARNVKLFFAVMQTKHSQAECKNGIQESHTLDQKDSHINICSDILKKNLNDPQLLERAITCDEL